MLVLGLMLRCCSAIGNRPVRTRTRGGVGAGGGKPPGYPISMCSAKNVEKKFAR